MNFKTLERRFDVVAYLKDYDPAAKETDEGLIVTCPSCDKDKLWVITRSKALPEGTKPAGTWICYYCDEGGTGPYSLVRWLEDADHKKTLEVLYEYANVDKPSGDELRKLVYEALRSLEIKPERWDTAPLPTMRMPLGFVPWPNRSRRAFSEAGINLNYFQERGIDEKRAKKYHLGFCARGYYRNRLIVPVYAEGKMVNFVARWMGKEPPDGIKKTIYPRGSKTNRVLFNYDRSKTCSRVILVEDVFSSMHLGKGSMCNFGTHLSQYQIELLLKTSAEEVIVLWDRDATVRHGSKKAPALKNGRCPREVAGKRCPHCRRYRKTWDTARTLTDFFKVKVPTLPDDRDPDEHPRRFSLDLIESTPYLQPTSFSDDIRSRLASL